MAVDEDGINVSSVWRGGGAAGGSGHAWMPAMCLPWPGRTPGPSPGPVWNRPGLMDPSLGPKRNMPQRLDEEQAPPRWLNRSSVGEGGPDPPRLMSEC